MQVVRLARDDPAGAVLMSLSGQIEKPNGESIWSWCADDRGEQLALFDYNTDSIRVYDVL